MSDAAAPKPRTLTIEMTSDNICPWCYVGRRRLQRALASLDTSVPVHWTLKPFFLDSTLPDKSINKLEHYQKKLGPERASAMLPRMVETGREDGIHFSYGGSIGNTMKSHRLMKYTQLHHPDKELPLLDAIFAAYFEHEKDIADTDTLVTIAQSVGLDGDKVREFLGGRELESDVQLAVVNAYRKGVSGVPHFTLTRTDTDQSFQISGGERPETFIQVFQRLGLPLKSQQ